MNCLLEDHDGNLWIGTERAGLACWQPRRFAHLTVRQGLPDDNVWTLTRSASGGIWIGTDQGVCLRDPGGGVSVPAGLSPTHLRVRALHEAADGTLWIGTGGSLEAWRDGRLTVIRWHEQPSANKVRVITTARKPTVRKASPPAARPPMAASGFPRPAEWPSWIRDGSTTNRPDLLP